MESRSWISQEKMFWTKTEWNEAFESVSKRTDYDGFSADKKMNLMIGYLIDEYPVSMKQLRDAKAKYAQ